MFKRPNEAEPAPRTQRVDGPGERPNVLVVDHNLTARMDLRAALHGVGFRVTACNSKASALQALRIRDYALAIVDSHLPDGPGVDILREIRTASGGERVPVIMLSTEAEAPPRARASALDANEYVAKPYDMLYVLKLASKLVGSLGHRPQASTTAPVTGRKILVADADVAFRQMLVSALRQDGHDVKGACSSAEVRALLSMDKPDAIILDYNVPEQGCLPLCSYIRGQSENRSISVLIMAAVSVGRDIYRKAIAAGADDLVAKSPEPMPIQARLRSLMSRMQREAMNRDSGARGEATDGTGRGPEDGPSSTRGAAGQDDRISFIPPAPPSWSSARERGEDRASSIPAAPPSWPFGRERTEDRTSNIPTAPSSRPFSSERRDGRRSTIPPPSFGSAGRTPAKRAGNGDPE